MLICISHLTKNRLEPIIDHHIANRIFKPLEALDHHERLLRWNKLRTQWDRGDRLVGSIFYKAPFGVYLDVDLEFPALLRIVDMMGLDYDAYQKHESYGLGYKIELSFVFMSEEPGLIDVREVEK